MVLSGGGAHRTVVLVIEGPRGAEIALEEAAKGLDIAFSRAGRDAKVTLQSGGREVTLENGKSLFSAAGQLKALSAPVRVVGERTYVSPSSAATVLGSALNLPAAYRAAYRALVIGAYEAPRLRLSNSVGPSSVESSVELSRPVPYDVRKEPNRIVVAFQADVMETDFTAEALPGRIVGSVRFERATPPRLIFDLGERFVAVRSAERDSQHLGFIFDASPPSAASPLSGGASPTPAPKVVFPGIGTAGFRRPIVLVIDPGHGGDDAGRQEPQRTIREGPDPGSGSPSAGGRGRCPFHSGLPDPGRRHGNCARRASGDRQQLQRRHLPLPPRERFTGGLGHRHRGVLPVVLRGR